jgi:hypothetical protein
MKIGIEKFNDTRSHQFQAYYRSTNLKKSDVMINECVDQTDCSKRLVLLTDICYENMVVKSQIWVDCNDIDVVAKPNNRIQFTAVVKEYYNNFNKQTDYTLIDISDLKVIKFAKT